MIGKRVESAEWRVQSSFCENKQKGFSLLELLIAMFILIILLAVAIPTYQRSIQHAREVVLSENIYQMERSIDQYTTDKGKAPQSLSDLVSAKYLREIPTDPITEEQRWQEVTGDDPNSDDGGQGLVEIKSLADGEDSNGKKYSDY